MNNLRIKTKLLILFILIKIIPLLIISYIAIEGAYSLKYYFESSTKESYNESKKIVENTAKIAIANSINALDKKSQSSLERLSFELANKIADFLYERDNDLKFLATIENIDNKVLKNFMDSKQVSLSVHGEYIYDDTTNQWKLKHQNNNLKTTTTAKLQDNAKEFHHIELKQIKYKKTPLYKEVQFIDLEGNELYKISTINSEKINIKDRERTYCKAEDYFKDITKLKKGEIYVSDVIGAYVPSKIIGLFTKAKAKKAGIKFEPEKYGYAGRENPVGKKFEGIVRFAMPVFKDNNKIGYVSFALDHRHIMEFSDSCNPTDIYAKQDISDASSGNYAFLWDYEGKNISHPRDYFIVGFDPNTGQRVPGWISADINEKFTKSNVQDMNKFLESYPKFEEQSLSKKPNIMQIKEGKVSLDCRYLNFAPQCAGWMNLTNDGGFGSFIIYWSNVWKLTTAATIPYYSGKYKNSKRGFGFVTIGANVDEFHSAANKTKNNVEQILTTQVSNMKTEVDKNNLNIMQYMDNIIYELGYAALIMTIIVIFIALWMSSMIIKSISNLLKGTKEYSKHNFDYKINITSKDEIGDLEKSFNDMSSEIKQLIDQHKEDNIVLDSKVQEQLKEIRKKDKILIQQSKMASMGEMIGNIAHQWRQPLNVIGTSVMTLQIKYENNLLDDEYFNKYVAKLNKTIQNMSHTIDDFRNFFAPNKDKVDFDIKDSIEETLSLLGESFRVHNVNISIYCDKPSKIHGYNNEFSQAILVILNNSKDAIVQNNILDGNIIIEIFSNDNKVKVTIKDNGGGIQEDIVDKVFEPYFTTKFKSQGTGIGLYMVKEIIENHMNGLVKIENIEDGAMITIELNTILPLN